MPIQESHKLLYKGEQRFTKPPVCKVGKPCVQRDGTIICIPRTSKCSTSKDPLPELPYGTGLKKAATTAGAITLAGLGGMALLGGLKRTTQNLADEPIEERSRRGVSVSETGGVRRVVGEVKELAKEKVNSFTEKSIVPVLGATLFSGAVGAVYGLNSGLRNRINEYINPPSTNRRNPPPPQSSGNPFTPPNPPPSSPPSQPPSTPPRSPSPPNQPPRSPSSFDAEKSRTYSQIVASKVPKTGLGNSTVAQPPSMVGLADVNKKTNQVTEATEPPEAAIESTSPMSDRDPPATKQIGGITNEKNVTPKSIGKGDRALLQRQWSAIPDPIQYESYIRAKNQNDPEFKLKSSQEKKQAYLDELAKIADRAEADLASYAEASGSETVYYQNRLKKLQRLRSEIERNRKKNPTSTDLMAAMRLARDLSNAMRRRNDSIQHYILAELGDPYSIGYRRGKGIADSLMQWVWKA